MIQAREIEVKYRVVDAADVELALATEDLVLSTPVHQDDQAYAPYGWSYGMSKQGVPFARLRTQDGRHLFTLKRLTDNELACLEFETEVADRDQMHDAILHMGFHPRSASSRPDGPRGSANWRYAWTRSNTWACS